MTKEEMLQKGISEEIADEIIASFSDSDENPLHALNKALEDDGVAQETLFKAEGEVKGKGKGKDEDDDDDDEGDEYDEQYMKKYMKKYMMANKGACKKLMKEVGIFGEKMEKAVSDIDTDADAAVIEMADLKPYLEAQSEMVKAVSTLAEMVVEISAKQDESYSLMQKAAKVTAIQAESLGEFLSTPQGRKGVVATEKMQKAITADMNGVIYDVLMKATLNKDQKAGEIISIFESAGKDANRLSSVHKQYINELLQKKEVN